LTGSDKSGNSHPAVTTVVTANSRDKNLTLQRQKQQQHVLVVAKRQMFKAATKRATASNLQGEN